MKKIIIIGAGIAGLCAGVFARLNGFDVEVFEMHSKPGGQCTGWQRGAYHFDNCIHWLMGSKNGLPLNKLWRTVGALDDSVKIINNEIFATYQSGDKTINIYRNLDRLKAHLLEVAPEDTKEIKRFCDDAKKFVKLSMPVDKAYDMFTKRDMFQLVFKMIPIVSSLRRYENISMGELAARFKNKDLQRAITAIIPSQYKASSLPATLASLHDMDSGWPQGGSLAFSKRIENKLLSLGAKLNYNCRVSGIIINDGKAKGIMLQDGSTHSGDHVVAAADGYEVIYNLLKGQYTDETIKTLYSDSKAYPVYSSVFISLGIEADLSNYPTPLYFKLKTPIDTGGQIHEFMTARHYCFEPSFAPPGCSAVTILFEADYDWWKKKKENPVQYKYEKERITEEVIHAFTEKFPESNNKIKKIDMATPLTYERYCNAYRGAWMSWAPTPGAKIRFITGMPQGLDNFYLTGQWTMPPGGLPTAVMTANWTIQRICARENVRNFFIDRAV
ncbi:MAG: NAD(P)/FAD-dependent oxidoreductase [Actinobacteria bacterium]|nr:NAD(P)/FAD-dependent oxidoreductase [Actinomycetota bacterium]